MCCAVCVKFDHCRDRTIVRLHSRPEPHLPNPHFHFCREHVGDCDLNCASCGRLKTEVGQLPLAQIRYGCCHRCVEHGRCDFIHKHRSAASAMACRQIAARQTAGVNSAGEITAPGAPSAGSLASRVLIVDDNDLLLRSLAQALGNSPQAFSARTASSGALAVKIFAEFQPHLVILDPSMPAPGGLDLCKAIRLSPRSRRTRIIALLRKEEQEHFSLAAGYGIDLCLSRDADPATIKHEAWCLMRGGKTGWAVFVEKRFSHDEGLNAAR